MALPASYQLNPRAMARGIGDSRVSGQQRGVKRFRQRDVDGVISGQVIPKRPDPPEQRGVDMTLDCQIGIISKRRGGLFAANSAGE